MKTLRENFKRVKWNFDNLTLSWELDGGRKRATDFQGVPRRFLVLLDVENVRNMCKTWNFLIFWQFTYSLSSINSSCLFSVPHIQSWRIFFSFFSILIFYFSLLHFEWVEEENMALLFKPRERKINLWVSMNVFLVKVGDKQRKLFDGDSNELPQRWYLHTFSENCV